MTTPMIEPFLRTLGQHLAAALVVGMLVGGPSLVEAARDGLSPAGAFALAAVDVLASDRPELDRGVALWMR